MNTVMRQVYDGFCAVREMDLPNAVRVRLLTVIGDHNPNNWQVVGIAPSAMEIFKRLDFKKPKSGSFKINRSHLVDRHVWMTEWLGMKQPLSFENWLVWYKQNDRTVLRSASNNMAGCDEDYIPIDPNLELFKSSGFSFRFSKKESAFLNELAK